MTEKKYLIRWFALISVVFVISLSIYQFTDKSFLKTLGNHFPLLKYFYKDSGDRAIKTLSKAILKNPDDAKLYQRRGFIYYVDKLYEKALADYSKAIQLKPQEHSFYSNRGRVYREMNLHEKAIEDYSKAIQLKSDVHKYYSRRGAEYLRMQLYEKAIEDYSKSIELITFDSDDAPEDIKRTSYLSLNYFERGYVYSQIQLYEKAIEDYSKAIRVTQNDSELPLFYTRRATEYTFLGRYNEAIEDLSIAINLGSDNTRYIANRGLVYLCNENYEKAFDDFDTARIYDIDDTSTFYLFRYISAKRGKINEGEILQSYLMNSNLTTMTTAIVKLYLGNITPDECLKIADNENDNFKKWRKAEAYYHIGQYYLIKGDKQKAKKMFKTCLDTVRDDMVDFQLYLSATVEFGKL